MGLRRDHRWKRLQAGSTTICGICGTTAARGARVLDAMNARMVHRGPDDVGVFIEAPGGVGLGARRLRVIDPAGGHQPLANEDETVWAVLNGEIYNFIELRDRLVADGHRFATRSDTEVLVHLYEERGTDLVHELEGMYAFAIWDARRRRLLLVRDRFGEKPLFYSERDGGLVFASELTALLAGVGGTPDLDAAALDAYFTFGYVPGDRCVVNGVKQLRAGHLLVWDAERNAGELSLYWLPPFHENGPKRPLEELVSETAELLERSVVSRLVADVPLGVFLSGGVDSTLVAAIATRHKAQLKTFTVDYDVGSVGERGAAREAAAVLGTDHHELVLTTAAVRSSVPAVLAKLDQPLADPAFVALWALSHFARQDVTVAVGGEGADELFGGYPRYRWLARGAALPTWLPRRLPAAAVRTIARASGQTRLSRLGDVLDAGPVFDRHVDWVTSDRRSLREQVYGPQLREVLERREPFEPPAEVDLEQDDILGSLMRLDQLRWLPDDVLAKADRATMHASLELRTPYLSKELAEFAATVPPAVHVQGGGKLLLRRVLRQTLPGFRQDPKVAFRTPCADWLRGPLMSSVEAQLRDSRLYTDGWLERGTVASWAHSHATGERDMSHALWPVFVLGCWYDANVPG